MARDRHNEFSSEDAVSIIANPEAVKADLENSFNHSGSALRGIKLEEDKEGNGSFLGWKIPKSAMPVVKAGYGLLQMVGIDKMHVVYNQALSIAESIPRIGRHAPRIAAFTQAAYVLGLVGSSHIIQFTKITSEWTKKRQEAFDDFSMTMKATGEKSANIKMLQLALAEANHQYWENLKGMGADLPTLGVQIIYAWQKYGEVGEQRQLNAEHQADPTKKYLEDAEKGTEALIDEVNADLKVADKKNEYLSKLRKGLEDRKENFVKKMKLEHPVMSEEAIKEEFQTNIFEPAMSRASKKLEGDISKSENSNTTAPADKSKKDQFLKYAAGAAPVLTEVIMANVDDSGKERRTRVHSWDMIKQLTQDIDSQPSRTSTHAIHVMGMVGAHRRDSIGLKEAILDIFQQYQRDLEPGKSFIEERENKGKKFHVLIDPLGEALVEQLMARHGVIDLLADRIADRRLSPEALKVAVEKIIRPEGIASADQVEGMLKNLVPVFRNRQVETLDKTLADFEKKAEAKKVIAGNLAELKGLERAVFAGMFSGDVLHEMGLRDKGIADLRREAEPCWNDFLISSASYISQLPDDKLKELKLSETHLHAIGEVAKAIKLGHTQLLESLANKGELVAAVRVAVLNEQINNTLGEGKAFLSNRIKEIPDVRNQIEEAAHKEKTNSFADHHPSRKNGSHAVSLPQPVSAQERVKSSRQHPSELSTF